MTVTNLTEAWAEVNKIFPTEYEKDEASSKRAGYDIYRHPTQNYYNRICDLGCRLEILTGEYGETVTNIWIKAEETEPEQEATEAEQPAEPKPEDALMEMLNHFIRDRGYEFKTPEELKAGFDRAWKCRCNELITQDEFVAEAGVHFEGETVRDTYNALAAMVESGKLDASDVYRYARFKWCLRNPSAVVAYEYEQRALMWLPQTFTK